MVDDCLALITLLHLKYPTHILWYNMCPTHPKLLLNSICTCKCDNSSRMNNLTSDEIFYSDDESSDGEYAIQVKFDHNSSLLWKYYKFHQVSSQDLHQQLSSALSYHPSVSSFTSSSSYRSSAPFMRTPQKPHIHGYHTSSMNIGSRQKNYLQEKEAPVTPSNPRRLEMSLRSLFWQI